MPSTKTPLTHLFLLLTSFIPAITFASHTPSLTNTHWQLTELMGKPIPQSAKPPYLVFDEKNGRYSGFGGCNQITGTYRLEKFDRIHFSQGASTLKACINGMDTEAQLFKVLTMTDNYAIHGKELQLYRARMAPLAKLTG